MVRIAFYAPIKPPDHPIASGDRQIARLLIEALEHSGHRVELASRAISYSKRSAPEAFADRRRHADAEARRLIAEWRARPAQDRPALWFTYHPYCKAPDWLGPRLCEEFAIPYVTAEACRTHQGTGDEWRPWREVVTAAVQSAAVNFWLTPTDRSYLATILPGSETMVQLRPFVDMAALRAVAPSPLPAAFDSRQPTLVTTAMMRPGAKARSYALLAAALRRIDEAAFNLLVIGDGPERAAVESALAFGPAGRLHFTGALDHTAAIAAMASADMFVWPGYREAIGMAYLEAQAVGLPVLALRTAGTPEAIADGKTGILTSVDDGSLDNTAAALAAAITELLANPQRRAAMGRAAAARIARSRDIGAAAAVLSANLAPLIDGGRERGGGDERP